MVAFIVCARLSSRRVPNKALALINGLPLLTHLINRLSKTGIQIIVATPLCENDLWDEWYNQNPSILKYQGDDLDPLARINNAAKAFSVTDIIRVTHDKIFVCHKDVNFAYTEFKKKKLDYLYSSTLTDGTGFEIISNKAIEIASDKFKNIEHVSYAIKAITDNTWNMPFQVAKGVRLLCDYECDLEFLEIIMSTLGNDAEKKDVENFCLKNPWVNNINRLPKLTIYTCAYNAENWIEHCMHSVEKQEGFARFEYILIDDASQDDTLLLMAKFKSKHPNVKIIKNQKNLGLASSSNIALRESKGKFIVRLDADDYFVQKTALRELLGEMHVRPLDAIYPANYYGSISKVQDPEENHHVGGAIFKTSALNHIKFTEKMRGFEGLDLYERAKNQLNIGYFARPVFFYRQHPTSLSKTNLDERQKIKQDIQEKYGA